jgi:hypothetical protein
MACHNIRPNKHYNAQFVSKQVGKLIPREVGLFHTVLKSLGRAANNRDKIEGVGVGIVAWMVAT